MAQPFIFRGLQKKSSTQNIKERNTKKKRELLFAYKNIYFIFILFIRKKNKRFCFLFIAQRVVKEGYKEKIVQILLLNKKLVTSLAHFRSKLFIKLMRIIIFLQQTEPNKHQKKGYNSYTQ